MYNLEDRDIIHVTVVETRPLQSAINHCSWSTSHCPIKVKYMNDAISRMPG